MEVVHQDYVILQVDIKPVTVQKYDGPTKPRDNGRRGRHEDRVGGDLDTDLIGPVLQIEGDRQRRDTDDRDGRRAHQSCIRYDGGIHNMFINFAHPI